MATPLHRGYQQHAKTAPTLYLGCAACCAPFTPLSAPRIAGDRIHSNQDSDTNIPPDPRAAGPPRSPPHVQWVEGCIAGCVCGGVVPPVGLVRMDLPCTPHVVEVLPRVALALWGQASKSNTEVMKGTVRRHAPQLRLGWMRIARLWFVVAPLPAMICRGTLSFPSPLASPSHTAPQASRLIPPWALSRRQCTPLSRCCRPPG